MANQDIDPINELVDLLLAYNHNRDMIEIDLTKGNVL